MRMPDTPLNGHDLVDYPRAWVTFGPDVSHQPNLLGHAVATLVLAAIAAALAWLFLEGGAPAGITHIGDTHQRTHVTTIDSAKWRDQRSSPS